MQKQYYYLVSSLPELTFDSGKSVLDINEFIRFCSEELDIRDYETLRKVFLFNDIKNAANNSGEGYQFVSPSYYLEEELTENLKDTDSFFVFLAEYFFNKKSEKRLFPELIEIDEIVKLLYQYLDEISSGFLKDYFLFELYLQNITAALSLRANDISYSDKIIDADYISEQIKKSSSPDFGISKEVDYLEKLIEIYKSNDLIKIEKAIEDIRWKWLEERVGINYFSLDAILAYAVKLYSAERWQNLSEDKGDATLNSLIDNISSNVAFPEEYLRR